MRRFTLPSLSTSIVWNSVLHGYQSSAAIGLGVALNPSGSGTQRWSPQLKWTPLYTHWIRSATPSPSTSARCADAS
jgi:hypothetical protein